MTVRGYGLLLIVLISGCTTTATPSAIRAVARTPINDITDETLALDYAHERTDRQEQGPPRLGLALSGGGTKAAMFSHGVLHGLHDAGILQKVDVISTVSGGGYAAYWYFSKLIASEENRFPISSIFRDCVPVYWTEHDKQEGLHPAMKRAVDRSTMINPDPAEPNMPACADELHSGPGAGDPFRWQAHLTRWPDVFGTTPVVPRGNRQGAPGKELRAGLFKALFIEPITQFLRSGSSIPKVYQQGIERTWGLDPMPRTFKENGKAEVWNYTNSMSKDQGPPRVDPGKVNWDALAKLHKASLHKPANERVPFWIINTNAGGKTRSAQENASRIFELTAFGSGSEKLGYVNNMATPLIPDLGTSVRASAGFADAQGLTRTERKIVEFLSMIIPAVRWGVPVETVNTSGETVKLRLSDGGGAENLGLYSLLKRGVKDIIVVDTAEDIEGNMEDLCAVRQALGKDMEMRFPTLQDLDGVCAGRLAYNVSDWKSPVIRGTVTWKKNGIPVRESRIWLLKAAWNQNLLARTYTAGKCGETGWAGCFLTVFYGHSTIYKVDGKNGSSEHMIFPQLPTTGLTLNSSSYFLWGYRELGRSIGRHMKWDDSQDRPRSTSSECPQPAARKVRGDRPYGLKADQSKQACASAQ